jgi:hypothetical protein
VTGRAGSRSAGEFVADGLSSRPRRT